MPPGCLLLAGGGGVTGSWEPPGQVGEGTTGPFRTLTLPRTRELGGEGVSV